MLLIPAIDLRGGRCVRLYQGDFAAETRYDYSPRELLEKYRALGRFLGTRRSTSMGHGTVCWRIGK